MLSDSKISTLESGLKNFRIYLRIRRMRVDDCRIRKEKVADSKISGYVWTGPYKANFSQYRWLFTLERQICLWKVINFPSHKTFFSRCYLRTGDSSHSWDEDALWWRDGVTEMSYPRPLDLLLMPSKNYFVTKFDCLNNINFLQLSFQDVTKVIFTSWTKVLFFSWHWLAK